MFIMKFLEEWDPLVNLNTKFDQGDIANLRIKYVNDMIFDANNTAEQGLLILQSHGAQKSKLDQVFEYLPFCQFVFHTKLCPQNVKINMILYFFRSMRSTSRTFK